MLKKVFVMSGRHYTLLLSPVFTDVFTSITEKCCNNGGDSVVLVNDDSGSKTTQTLKLSHPLLLPHNFDSSGNFFFYPFSHFFVSNQGHP